MIDAVLSYLHDPNPAYTKQAVQCFASAYPFIFQHFIHDPGQAARWPLIGDIRTRLLVLFGDSTVPTGTKIALIKAFQRIVLVQISGGAHTSHNDVNVDQVPPGHPVLQPRILDSEARDILFQLVPFLYTSTQVDLVMATMNTLAMLARNRTSLVELACRSLIDWTPEKFAGRLEQRFVEKALRMLYRHMIRFNVGGSAFRLQFQAALEIQTRREAEAERAYALAREVEAKRKRDELAEEIAVAAGAKRPRTGNEPSATSAIVPSVPEVSPAHAARAFQSRDTNEALANFDVTQLPLSVVVDLVIANFHAITEATLEEAVSRTRASLATDPSAGQDEVMARPEPAPTLEHFELASPTALPPSQASDLMKGVIVRMTNIGMDEIASRPPPKEDDIHGAPSHPVLWSSLISRLAVRGLYVPLRPGASEDELLRRDAMLKYADQLRTVAMRMVLEDPEPRLELASRWLIEEWTSDPQRARDGLERKYEPLLVELLAGLRPKLVAESKWIIKFIDDLPLLPAAALEQLVELAKDRSTVQLGLFVLREIAVSRPPVRPHVTSLLLGLTRSSDELLRRGAITTVRVWVTNAQPPPPLQSVVLVYAHQSLDRLTEGLKADDDDTLASAADQANEPIKVEGDVEASPSKGVAEVKMEDADEDTRPITEAAPEAAPVDPRSQWDETDVLRYLELTLALCVKVPSLLNDVFATYVHVSPDVQAAMEKHITRLIASMGPHHPILLELLSHFPEGAEGLALTVFQIMFDKEKSPALVQLVLKLSQERTLDARFLLPIIPELKKVCSYPIPRPAAVFAANSSSQTEVLRLLPRVVSLLDDASGAQDNLELIKNVFESIVAPPDESFGQSSSNQPRQAQDIRVTPTELMGLLHRRENDIGKKAAARAVQICLNMADVFRAEVLAATMNQIIEEPVLPTIFLRTVLMAVDKFPSLKGYVSGNLLSRLITKKVWLDPLLWTGFIMAVKKTAPGSYAALAQLPKDQTREIAAKDPELREGLRDYFIQKTGNNPARMRPVLELLGYEPDAP